MLDFYRQRNHLAARVMASRADDATGVALTYAVDPGPWTAIRAQGVTLDGADERRLREAWQESVVDALLVDEARSIVTRAMSARGFVRARVDARLVQDGDTRVLAIEVEPGTVVQGTSIRVDMAEGADTAMASDLVEALTQRGLVERAVAEPDALVRASADYLRTVGYVDPKVRVSPPTFDGTRADVRVQVDPGVLLRLGRVRFAGMRGVPVADLEMSAALATGAPYEVSVLDAARDRLGDLYRRKGFARAAVSYRGDAEAAGLRDVVYEIGRAHV